MNLLAPYLAQKDSIPIIIGGDFNVHSHLYWQENTKNLWKHQETVVRWDCSVLLSEAGFIDSFREKYPNPVTHPGFTYPANNPDVTLKDLDWTPEVDGRDRIDFIYYYSPSEKSPLAEVVIYTLPRCKVLWNHAPLTACLEKI